MNNQKINKNKLINYKYKFKNNNKYLNNNLKNQKIIFMNKLFKKMMKLMKKNNQQNF